jgi:large subunit ribosomal protein L35
MSSKTHKGLKKRLKSTRTGKLFHRHCGKSHLMSGKSGKRAMRLGQWEKLSPGLARSLRKQYGKV